MGNVNQTAELVLVSERGEPVSPSPLPPQRPSAGGQLCQELLPRCDARLTMRSGTGRAKADGPGGPTHDSERARARIDYDVAYIQNFSFWLDLKVLFTILRHEFAGGFC